MKKLFLLFAGLLCAPAVFAASTTTKNTMKMVAYFPVPYVAYDTVSATQALDVGVLNECRMSLGENQSNLGGSNCSLYLYGAADGTDDARRGLLNVSAGKLDLNATGFTSTPIIRSSKVLVGSGGTADTAGYGLLEIGKPGGKDPNFNALYISSLANGGDSVRATGRGNSVSDMAAKVTEFKMFDEITNNFPACNGIVTWQELELGGNATNNKTYKDVYLVCGTAAPEPEPEPEPDPEPELTCANYDYKFAHKSECCPKMPQSDEVCWTESFVWGPIKAISGNFTMRYPAASRVTDDRCHAPVNPLVYTLVSPEQLYTSGFISCPGKDSSQVQGQQCVPTTDIGPGITTATRCLYADYTSASNLPHAYYVGYQGCTVKSEYCDCKASSWAGHECISNGFKKNGW